MALGTLFKYLAIAFVIWRIAKTAYEWQRLRHIKGPWIASVSRLWEPWAIASGQSHQTFLDVSEKYGDLARIGPNLIMTSDPALHKRMHEARTKYTRSDWYVGMRFDPSRDNLASVQDDAVHFKLRAKLAPGYGGKGVEGVEDKINNNISALIRLVERKYLTRGGQPVRPMDLSQKLAFMSTDTIGDLAFGEPFGFLAKDEDLNGMMQQNRDTVTSIMLVTTAPWLNWFLRSRIMKPFIPSPENAIGFGAILKVASQVVNKRYAPDAEQQRDMLGSFISNGLTKEEAYAETTLQVIAGSDTTASTIRAAMLHIITAPRVEAKLLAEIRRTGIPSPPTSAETKKLPYLQAVIKESLRIFPPVGSLMTKNVPAGGDVWKGVRIPEGTHVGLCVWGMYRRPEIWGEDVDVFRPERWLEAEADKLAEMDQVILQIFGSGKWTCLGREIALIETAKAIVELIRRFHFTVLRPQMPWEYICGGVFFHRYLWVSVMPREDRPF